MATHSIRESIREVDENSWLIGDTILLSHTSSNGTWEDGNGGGYSISNAPSPPPVSRPLSDQSDIKLVYDAGNVSAVFKIGEAYCKAKILDKPNATREHTTLAWLHQQPWSFAIPNVLYHAEHNGRYYIITSRVPGNTVDNTWPSLDGATKQRYAERVADICKELAISTNNTNISGIDGNELPEFYLCGPDKNCTPQNLRKTALELEMDCSTFVFYQCDLGPTNVLVDSTSSFGIIDWEAAGFVPVEWIRSKFRLSRGMNLSCGDELDYRRRVGIRLGELGFTDVVERFMLRIK